MNARKTVFSILLLAAVMGISAPVFLKQNEAEAKHVEAEQFAETGEDTPDKEEDFSLAMVPEYSGIAYADINGDVPFFTEEEMTAETFHEYWALDELGRCTGAYACIGPELLPTEERGNISGVEPTGWHSVQYEGIDGGSLYNRCHLIGYQLTGQNAEERNLITGTRYLNTEGMLPFENSVRMYVEGTGNHVLYRVRPYFQGKDLLARGILMEAKSIEDPLVQFCAFCYNVQPGIKIDYATGDSVQIEQIPEPQDTDVTPIEADPVDNATSQDNSDTREAKEITYILNTNTRKFHYPYCSSVKDIKDKNKLESTQSREEIIESGYQPCKRCNP